MPAQILSKVLLGPHDQIVSSLRSLTWSSGKKQCPACRSCIISKRNLREDKKTQELGKCSDHEVLEPLAVSSARFCWGLALKLIFTRLLVSLLIEDPEKFNDIETKTREAQIPELHNFKLFSDQIRAGQERQLAALIKDSEAAIENAALKLNSQSPQHETQEEKKEPNVGAAASAGKRRRRPRLMPDSLYGMNLTTEQRRHLFSCKSDDEASTRLLLEQMIKEDQEQQMANLKQYTSCKKRRKFGQPRNINGQFTSFKKEESDGQRSQNANGPQEFK